MKLLNIDGNKIYSVEHILRKYATSAVNLKKMEPYGYWPVSKSEKKQISAPYSMRKLLDLEHMDEYHAGCLDAISMSAVTKVEVSDSFVKSWIEKAQFPSNESMSTILSELIRYYSACGNGFLIKMRNAKGEWVGLERLLPSEVQILENYDAYGFLKPDYVQVKNGKKLYLPNKDVIHFKKNSHKSNAWGLACLPIAINAEILSEIKTYDYNNFKNGLLIDYFLIVEGGSLKDNTIENSDGETVISDAYSEIEAVLKEAKGNSKSHSTVLIESEDKDVKIKLEPLRQEVKDGGFLALKKDIREGIFAYHRVPPRLVSQLVPGQLGGDYKSEMLIFYRLVLKPIQERLSVVLASEFNSEFNKTISPESFNFGDLEELYLSEDEKLFNTKIR